MTHAAAGSIFEHIDLWFTRAPEGLSENDAVRWVQRNADIPCPQCNELLWIMRTRRAGDRGFYHLATCQNETCSFQIDD